MEEEEGEVEEGEGVWDPEREVGAWISTSNQRFVNLSKSQLSMTR